MGWGTFIQLWTLGLWGFTLPGFCIAQVLPGPARDTGAPADHPRVSPPSGMKLDTPVPFKPSVDVAGVVWIRQFRLSGLTALKTSELEVILASWTGRSLSARDFDEILKTVTAYLREHGLFAAYAYFPDQDIADGEAVLQVVEGQLGKLNIEHAAPRLSVSVAEGFLSSLQPGSRIIRGQLDTPLLLLNDLPGVRVRPGLVPGDEPGISDLMVRIEDEPIAAGYLRFDNYQTRELGQYEVSAHLRIRNALGIGDLATGEFVRSHTDGRARGTLTYSQPVNYKGTRIAALVGNQRYRLGGDLEPLRANGDWTRLAVAATHPFVRMDDRSLSGSLSLNRVDYRDKVDAVGFMSKSRHRYATARFAGDLRDRVYGGGRSALYLEYQVGRVSLDTPEVATADAASLNVAGSFHRGRFYFERNQSLSSRSYLVFAWTTQIASQNLDFGNKMLFSGPEAVRAYGSSELMGDEGYLTKLEYRHLLSIWDGWRSVIAVFWDSAHARINNSPLPSTVANVKDIWGYGVWVAVARHEAFTAQIAFAWRGEPPIGETRQPRLWFTTMYAF